MTSPDERFRHTLRCWKRFAWLHELAVVLFVLLLVPVAASLTAWVKHWQADHDERREQQELLLEQHNARHWRLMTDVLLTRERQRQGREHLARRERLFRVQQLLGSGPAEVGRKTSQPGSERRSNNSGGR
jgi:hypothetical protein